MRDLIDVVKILMALGAIALVLGAIALIWLVAAAVLGAFFGTATWAFWAVMGALL